MYDIQFKFCTDQEMHQRLNWRRDCDELLDADELARKEADWDLQVVQKLMNTYDKHQLKV